MRYLLINEQGYVANTIIWDGVSPYSEPNKTLMLESEAPVGVSRGWQLVDGEWIVPIVEEEVNHD